MPRLSDSMEEATIVRWLKAHGDTVALGDELVEIETDKATVVYEAEQAGVLEIRREAGETVALGGVIAAISGAGDANAPVQSGTTRVAASPVARRIAIANCVDLAAVTGTGPVGRVTKRDVLSAVPAQPAAGLPSRALPPVTAPVALTPGSLRGTVSRTELSRLQTLIAQRMTATQQSVPDFTVTVEVDMDAAVELRQRLRELRPDGAGLASYNDLVIRACALALREHPRVNGSYRDAGFELHEQINIGVAVATAGSLIVPVVRDADQRDLGAIAAETRRIVERVRDGSVTPAELEGGTFTVSNLGMYGVREFTAIVNAPEAAILAVGELAPRPVVRDGEIVVAHTMSLTLSADHRILYGADAAAFLARVRALLQEPLALVVS